MANTGNMTILSVAAGDLLTDIQLIKLSEISCGLMITLLVMGVLGNIINIRTFILMGLTDGFIVAFFFLSIFDMMYLIATIVFGVTGVFFTIELKSGAWFPMEPYGVFIFSGNCALLINVTNTLTTTYLAVARCLCVSRPLSFQNTFTSSKTILVMMVFCVFAVSIYVPIFVNMRMNDTFNTARNSSRPSLWVSPAREHTKVGVWMTVNICLPIITQFVIIFCVIVMSRCLLAASRFRNTFTSASIKFSEKDNTTNSSDSESTTTKLSRRDLRVVQQVVLISVVYIISNVPKICISVATTIVPEFTLGRRYFRIYMCAMVIRYYIEIINASVNVFIYYKYNMKFRSLAQFWVNNNKDR